VFRHNLSRQLGEAEHAFLRGLMAPRVCEIEEGIGCDRISYAAEWLIESGEDTKIRPYACRINMSRAQAAKKG
jgi:hypothetical protein